jgi:hypothetical protein
MWKEKRSSGVQGFSASSGAEQCENRPMYSCGSLVNHSAITKVRHSQSDDCCAGTHGGVQSLAQPWEMTDGAVKLLGSLLQRRMLPPAAITELTGVCMPELNGALEECSSTDHVLRCTILSVIKEAGERIMEHNGGLQPIWLTDELIFK